MRSDRRSVVAAAVGVVSTAAVAFWGFMVVGDLAPRWFVIAAFLPTLWVFMEYAQVRGDDESVGRAIMTMHRSCIAWAGLMLSTQTGVRLAVHTGILSQAWLPTGQRFGGLVLAIGMILFGNALPTLRSPWTLLQQPFAWQQVHRFVGWVFVLAGLGVAASWTLLAVGPASHASARILGVTVVLSIGRKLASVITHSTPRTLA